MNKIKQFQLQSNHNFDKLLTLDNVIEQLDDYVTEDGNTDRAWGLMVLYRDALNEPITPSMFVKTDKEGASNLIFIGWVLDIAPNYFVNYYSFVHLYTKREIRFKSAKRIVLGWHDPFAAFVPVKNISELAILTQEKPLSLIPCDTK